MKNSPWSTSLLKNFFWSALLFVLLVYIVFGAVNFSIQKRSFEQSSLYVVSRLEQLQLNIEVLHEVYVKEYGAEYPITRTIASLLEQSKTIQTYDELETFITEMEKLRKEQTYSKESKQYVQKVLSFNLYVITKMKRGVEDLRIRQLSYIGVSRIFPGMQFLFPIDPVYLPLRTLV